MSRKPRTADDDLPLDGPQVAEITAKVMNSKWPANMLANNRRTVTAACYESA